MLSRKLCKGLLMFPEDFPAMLAVLTFWKRQVATCVDASPCCLWAEQLAVKSCPFSPGCVEPVSQACQALELRLIQKEGPMRGAVGKARDLELQVERKARTRKEKKKKTKTIYKVLPIICGSKQWKLFLWVWGGGGKLGDSVRPRGSRIHSQFTS